MSDEEAAIEIGKRLLPALRKVVEALNDLIPKVRHFLDLIAKVGARLHWYEQQQIARTLAHHPDLASLDGWLDRWYPDPVAAPYRGGRSVTGDNPTREKPRRELLLDLADAVRELTEPRTHNEYLEAVEVETVTGRNGTLRQRRRVVRRRHTVTLPALLDALRDAAVPGAGEGGAAVGGFESRPSAELEPLAVLGEIIADAGYWSRVFDIERPTLAKTVSALVGAPHDDGQLAFITRQAVRWVKRAKLATGFDPAPFTLGAPCPYCRRRNSLVVSGDMRAARCSRCLVDWSPDTIGLLADMLTQNETHETLALEPCWQQECTRYGAHDKHQDSKGRTWGDTCDVSA